MSLTLLKAGGGSFIPLQQSSVQLWVEGDHNTGLNDNDPISSWPDFSGNGRNLIAAATVRPLYKVNILNGKPAARFDGINDVMTLAVPLVLPDTVTLHFCYANRTGTNGTFFSTDEVVGNAPLQRNTTQWAQAATGSFAGPVAGLNVYNIVTYTFDYVADEFRLFRHGVQDGVLTGTPVANPLGNIVIGARRGFLEFLVADLLGIIIRGVVATTAERLRVERYFAGKYGLSTT